MAIFLVFSLCIDTNSFSATITDRGSACSSCRPWINICPSSDINKAFGYYRDLSMSSQSEIRLPTTKVRDYSCYAPFLPFSLKCTQLVLRRIRFVFEQAHRQPSAACCYLSVSLSLFPRHISEDYFWALLIKISALSFQIFPLSHTCPSITWISPMSTSDGFLYPHSVQHC